MPTVETALEAEAGGSLKTCNDRLAWAVGAYAHTHTPPGSIASAIKGGDQGDQLSDCINFQK